MKKLFSGAPHFILEKGRHGILYPQVFFPWNPDVETGDLNDRRVLQHESFTVATLHAHLPIPDQDGGHPIKIALEQPWKRPAFDIGVFEVPNMLAQSGWEPGALGFRAYMELPFADALKTGNHEHEAAAAYRHLADLPANEALTSMQHGHEPSHEPVQDRLELIREGHHTWKRIGLRDVTMKTIVERIVEIVRLRDELVLQDHKITILDKHSSHELYSELFTKLLHPSPGKASDVEDPYSLKVQIEALVKVLAIKGAWIDFSLVEWRIRLGQVLWETSLHVDEGFPEPLEREKELKPGEERKWLLLQILLALELLIRLDATVKLAIVQRSEDLHVTPHEVHHFNKLRTRKVDWDLILARIFLDNLYVKVHQTEPSPATLSRDPESHTNNWLMSKFTSQKRHHSSDAKSEDWSWDCVILPRRPKGQLAGLLRFAKSISWPNLDTFEKNMTEKLEGQKSALSTPTESVYATPLHSPLVPPQSARSSHFGLPGGDSPEKKNARRSMLLQRPDSVLEGATIGVGGWLSRSWLTALVLPGEAIFHFLISTLLENDHEALIKLGDSANLYGGFVFEGRSWWSRSCIAGRVLACLDGGAECMGWISTTVVPVSGDDQPFTDGWLDVEAKEAPAKEMSRLCSPKRLQKDSSPLGIGEGQLHGSEFTLPTDEVKHLDRHPTVAFQHLTLQPPSLSTTEPRQDGTVHENTPPTLAASATFTVNASPVTLELKFGVHFISAFACRPPQGHAAHVASISPVHKPHEHLPAHPLHKSHRFAHKSIQDLLKDPTPPPVAHEHTDTETETETEMETHIIDARCGTKANTKRKECLVRAWCASTGHDAIVARAGRTCLSCAVREAKACGVRFVIRTGIVSVEKS